MPSESVVRLAFVKCVASCVLRSWSSAVESVIAVGGYGGRAGKAAAGNH